MFNGDVVNADVWSWNFMIAKYTVYTTSTNSSNANLHRWSVNAGGNDYNNDYVDYQEVPASEAAAFRASFQVPAVCNNAMSCDQARRAGKISAKSLAFLRSGAQTAATPS